MPTVTRTALVAYSPAELFALVNDVEAYPQFLPHCTGTQVLERATDTLVARMTFARAGLSQSVTTRNRLLLPRPQQVARIDMELVEGPFARLLGSWEFRPLGDAASKVLFSIDFDIDSQLAHLAAGPLVGQAALVAMDAFQQRAAALYGRRF